MFLLIERCQQLAASLSRALIRGCRLRLTMSGIVACCLASTLVSIAILVGHREFAWLGLFGLLCIPASAFWAIRMVSDLRVKRLAAPELFAGSRCTLSLQLTELSGRLRHGLEIVDDPARRIGLYFCWQSLNLEPGACRVLGHSVRLHRRGRYQLPDLMARSSFPFGLVEAQCTISGRGEIVVYPKPAQVDLSVLQHQADSDQTDDFGQRAQLGALVGVLPFQAGDRISSICWSATARTRALQVARFADPMPGTCAVILQGWSPRKHRDRRDLKGALQVTCGLLLALREAGYSFWYAGAATDWALCEADIGTPMSQPLGAMTLSELDPDVPWKRLRQCCRDADAPLTVVIGVLPTELWASRLRSLPNVVALDGRSQRTA